METPVFSFLVLFTPGLLDLVLGVTRHHQISSSPSSCFSPCICKSQDHIQCRHVSGFTERLADFNRFLMHTKTSEKWELHIETDKTSLPKFIRDLPVVRYLSLAHNRISLVQNDVLRGLRLRELNLSRNAIEVIEDSALKSLYHLQVLDLSYNRLSTISKLVFSNLPKLQVLNLDSNSLLFFPFDSFNHVPLLEILTVNNNHLTYLMPGSLSSLSAVRSLELRNNSLWSPVLDIVEEMPALEVLDVSRNPFHCSCTLRGLAKIVNSTTVRLAESSDTKCFTPLGLRGRRIADVVFQLQGCEKPVSVVEYVSRDVIYTGDIELSCDIQGDPDPALLWVTPWGDEFAHSTQWAQLESVCDACKERRKYSSPAISLESTVSVLNSGKNLQITNFRGFFDGNITCRAYNYLGNDTAVLQLHIYAGVQTAVQDSLFIGAFTAGGFLCVGLLVGSIKLVALACLAKFGLKRKVARTPTTLRPSSLDERTSLITDSHCQTYSFDFNSFDENCSEQGTTGTGSVTAASPDLPNNGQDTPVTGKATNNIRDTMDEVRGRLKSGVGRKMKTVKRNVRSIKETGRRNVQSIKESGSMYMHNIMETGSTAASKVKAGVVMGVETVKYHVQSIKEFCGTGDMGTQTVSMISVETNLDTNETTEVVKSVTLV